MAARWVRTAEVLDGWLVEGKKHFTVQELAAELEADTEEASKCIKYYLKQQRHANYEVRPKCSISRRKGTRTSKSIWEIGQTTGHARGVIGAYISDVMCKWLVAAQPDLAGILTKNPQARYRLVAQLQQLERVLVDLQEVQ